MGFYSGLASSLGSVDKSTAISLPNFEEFKSENENEILKELKEILKNEDSLTIKLSTNIGNDLFKDLGINETFEVASPMRSVFNYSYTDNKNESNLYPISLLINKKTKAFFIKKSVNTKEITAEISKKLIESYASIISNRKLQVRLLDEEQQKLREEENMRRIEKERKSKEKQEEKKRIAEQERVKKEEDFNNF